MHRLTINTNDTRDTIVRIVQVCARQGCIIRKIVSSPNSNRQIITIEIEDHHNITHIKQQLTKLVDVHHVAHKELA